MSSAMKHLKPYFQSGETKRKGKFIVGTVAGDLHDIGKNLVAMMVEGGGWEGNRSWSGCWSRKIPESIRRKSGSCYRLSALLNHNYGEYEEDCFSH